MTKRNLARNVKKREQKIRFLVVSEGAVTEMEYLDAVKRDRRLSSADVKFVPPGPTSPFEIVTKARDLRNEAKRTDPYDFVWCLFDTETKITQNARPRISEAAEMARKLGIEVAISNPCIELWLLLHVEDRQAWIDSHVCQAKCAELEVVIGKHICDPDALYKSFQDAKRRAIALMAKHEREGKLRPEEMNPSTCLYKLVDCIRAAYPSDAD